ncbi:MAG TPA: hypothetical protein VF020_03160 [Chthoniobacterales bacterium]
MQVPLHVPLEGPTEKKGFFINGPIVAIAEVVLVFVALGSIFTVALTRLSGGSVESGSVSAAPITIGLVTGFVLLLIVLLILRGFRLLRHDQALVLSSGGRYLGTIRGGGLIWTNPFISRRKVALHTHRSTVQHPFAGMRSATADVSWKVTDTSKAINVAHYDQSVKQAIEDSLSEVGANASPEQFNTALTQHLGEIGVISTKVEVRSGRIAL